MVKLLVPERAWVIAAGCSRHEKKAGDTFTLQDGKHIRERVNQTVIAGHQNGACRKLLALLNPGSKVIGMNDVIVSFQETELLSKNLWLHQVSIEKRFAAGMVERNNTVVVYDRIAPDWRNQAQASGVMQNRIRHVLQEWAHEPHRLKPDHIVTIERISWSFGD
jgi:hypothetical protein